MDLGHLVLIALIIIHEENYISESLSVNFTLSDVYKWK